MVKKIYAYFESHTFTMTTLFIAVSLSYFFSEYLLRILRLSIIPVLKFRLDTFRIINFEASVKLSQVGLSLFLKRIGFF